MRREVPASRKKRRRKSCKPVLKFGLWHIPAGSPRGEGAEEIRRIDAKPTAASLSRLKSRRFCYAMPIPFQG